MLEQLRASKITIDMPKSDSMPWVQITVQKVLRDEETYAIRNVLTRWEQFSIPLNEIMEQQLPVKTVSNSTVTGGELFGSIYTLVILALQEKYGGSINEKQDLIL